MALAGHSRTPRLLLHALLGLTGLWILLACQTAMATAQIPDRIQVDGADHPLISLPLDPFLQDPAQEAKFKSYFKPSCTASWRGYAAHWEIRDDTLYLTRIFADPCSDKPTQVPLSLIAPRGTPKSVKSLPATWYTGDLLIPLGKMVEYVHMGFESRYEKYLLISVKDGRVTGRKELDEKP